MSEVSKVTQYSVCVQVDLAALVNEVNFLLQKGWSLYGDIIIFEKSNDLYHLQVLVK